MLVETHAHLCFDKFDPDREEVIQRAMDIGVKKIINIATDLENAKQCIALAEAHEGLYATVGIHPTDGMKLTEPALVELKELASHQKVVAIGEIGMDFYWDTCPVDVQEFAFRQQIRLASELEMPLVIHNREAGRVILDILKSEGVENLQGVFHCFSETVEIAREVLDMGLHISFTGNLTFKKSTLSEVAKMIPADRLLLETDCPFLSPEPKRGRRNEPAHIVHIAQKLAELKGVSYDQIAEITTRNALSLFRL